METSPNHRDSKECFENTNGTRHQTISRLDRSSSRNKDDNETNIIRSNTTTSLSEQAKPDELASGKEIITKFSKTKSYF
jgi:hypothetical protein